MGKEEREEREEEGEDREEREKERERSDPLSFPQERREGLCLSLQGIQFVTFSFVVSTLQAVLFQHLQPRSRHLK